MHTMCVRKCVLECKCLYSSMLYNKFYVYVKMNWCNVWVCVFVINVRASFYAFHKDTSVFFSKRALLNTFSRSNFCRWWVTRSAFAKVHLHRFHRERNIFACEDPSKNVLHVKPTRSTWLQPRKFSFPLFTCRFLAWYNITCEFKQEYG